MAIFRPGPLVGGISGDVGGVNFVNTRGGKVVRKARRSSPATTPLQRERQSNFQRITAHWSTLTDAERLAWATFAKDTNRTNRLGVQSQHSGYIEFVRHNMWRSNLGSFIQPTPVLDFVPTILQDVSFVSDASAGIIISYLPTDPFTAKRGYVYGRRLWTQNPKTFTNSWKYITFMNTNNSDTFVISTEWDDILGRALVGQRVAVRLFPATFPDFQPQGVFQDIVTTVA